MALEVGSASAVTGPMKSQASLYRRGMGAGWTRRGAWRRAGSEVLRGGPERLGRGIEALGSRPAGAAGLRGLTP